MERENRTDFVGVKVPSGLLELIDKDVSDSDEFSSRSTWIVEACRRFEEYRTKIKADRKVASENEDFIASSGSLQSDQNIKTK